MRRLRQRLKITLIVLISMLCFIKTAAATATELSLTEAERAYIADKGVIKVVSLDGVAPLQFTDSKGEIRGIAIDILNKISELTGLRFDIKLYDSIEEVKATDYDIFFGIDPVNVPKNMSMSQPYLTTETILFVNDSVDLNQLEHKVYAALQSSKIPKGIKEENVRYFDTREETMRAVDAGIADYGYGNAYSVVFYTMQNGYSNLVTIPNGKEERQYRLVLVNSEEHLLSIINKAIGALDEAFVQNLILKEASSIEKKITFTAVINAYGKEICGVIVVVMLFLLFSIINYVRMNKKLSLQNRRHEMLSQISNEYLYEYFVEGDRMELSEQCKQLFQTEKNMRQAISLLKSTLMHKDFTSGSTIIKLAPVDDKQKVFRVISSRIYDDSGRLDSIIGKLIDISEEEAEKELLITKSQIDGLTGLYNMVTTKELIVSSLQHKAAQQVDALLLIDCDKFKQINDTYGHLIGDQVLKHISQSLQVIFDDAAIMGRLGGDEFCVYIKDALSAELVMERCEQLNALMQEVQEAQVTLSIGIVLIAEAQQYETLFKMADDALYQAKHNGRAQTVFH